MAIMKNTELLAFAAFDRKVTGKPVGNNRTVTHRDDSSGRLQIACALHGHTVLTLTHEPKELATIIEADSCGYLTSTTIAAINDFLSAAGYPLRASRAGGVLSLNSRGRKFTAEQGGKPVPVTVTRSRGEIKPRGWTVES